MYEKTLLYFYFVCTLEVLPQGGTNKYCYNIVVRDLTQLFFNTLFPSSLFSSDGVRHGFKAV